MRHQPLRTLSIATALCALLLGCGGAEQGITDKGTTEKRAAAPLRTESALPLDNVVADQLDTLALDGQSYLLLASETRGLVLLDDSGAEVLSLQRGKIERFALQPQVDGSWLLASYDKNRGELALRRLSTNADGMPQLQLLTAHKTAAPQVALCFSRQADHSHLFAIDEDGLGREYALAPGSASSNSQWRLRDVRPLYFGEQVSSCAVDDARGHLYVAQPPLGIWRLNSNAERDEARGVFVAGGALGDDFGGLWLEKGADRLWFTSGRQVRAYRLGDKGEGGSDPGDSEIFARDLAQLQPVSAVWRTGELLALEDEGKRVERFSVSLPPARPAPAASAMVMVKPRAETAPVTSGGDAADDPAIWVNPRDSAASRILGTDKKSGLNVYDLSGALRQHFPVGRLNNVDLRPTDVPGFSAIAAASNRSTAGINLFGITAGGEVQSLGWRPLAMPDPYGLCMFRRDHRTYVWVTDKEGGLQLLEIAFEDRDRDWRLKPRGTVKVASQTEGCVTDDARQTLFFGEEDRGIWRLDMNAFLAGEGHPQLVAEVDGHNLVDDVEGMSLYVDGDSGYLVVSSQGSNSYALYSRDGSRFLGRFRVGADLQRGIDGSSETDGLDVTSAALGADYPQGLLVVQDGRNRLPSEAQNFKLVAWDSIAAKLRL
ncbi:phytase [Microbulbifer sp. SAOS-129_SWC]|uniref:phytase n=1 Tax=Microbulbifer sp. SAOS-129_SWC TaxID=3145235 RepID=UPI003217A7BC